MRTRTTLAASALVLLTGAPAYGQEVSPAASMTQAAVAAQPAPPEYERVLGEAVVEFNAGHFTEARALFAQAHALFPTARTFRALGLVEYELRNYARCIEALSHALSDQRRALEAAARPQLLATLSQAARFVGRFQVPADVAVSVDGRPAIRDSQGAVLIEVGKHVLALGSQAHAIDVRGGETIDLRPATAASAAASASTQARAVARPAPVPDEPFPWPQVALMGGGGVLFVSGLVVGAVALDAHADFESACPESTERCATSAREQQSRVQTLSAVSDVLWITGAATASAGFVWWLLDGSAGETPRASAWTTGEAVGLDLSGRF